MTTTQAHCLTPDCNCPQCADIDWDVPCMNCGMAQRDCCGCHDGQDCDGICNDCGKHIDDHDLRAYACDVQS